MTNDNLFNALLSLSLSSSTLLQWIIEKATEPDILCLVLFRGSWCKYDKYYLQRLGKFFKAQQDEKISLIAWTSEGEAGAKKADEEWGLTKDCGFSEVVGDSSNALANYLIDDVVLPKLKIMSTEEAGVGDLVQAGSYPNGIVMPGIVCYGHHEAAPVMEWAHSCDQPGNKGGPMRPEPEDMWKAVVKRKHALDHGDAVMPSRGTNMKMCATDSDLA